MRYIKLFENFGDISNSELIEKYWFVEPYNFSHIVISSLEEAGLYPNCTLSFSMLMKDTFRSQIGVDKTDELLTFFNLVDGEIIVFPNKGLNEIHHDMFIDYLDNYYLHIDVLFDNNDYTKIEKFYDIVNVMLSAHKMPYKAPYPSYRYDDRSISISFEYTFEGYY